MVRAMQKMKLPEDRIYAYYKTDGILPSSENMNQYSEKDLEEFEAQCREYREATEGELQNPASILQYVKYANEYLEDQLGYVTEALIACLNNFIRRHSKELKIYEFEMKSELDYCMFSALKTIKTMESINTLRKNSSVEDQFREDAGYLCGKLNEILKICLEMVESDPEHQNAVLELLVRRIEAGGE